MSSIPRILSAVGPTFWLNLVLPILPFWALTITVTIDYIHRIRYPDPAIKVNDTVKIELSTGKITEFIPFDTGAIAMATGGRNMGRVGVITHRERHDGGFNIVHIKDVIDNSFATRESNVFVIGKEKPWISLPKGKGVKVCYLSIKNLSFYPVESFCSLICAHFFCFNSSQLRKREIVVVQTQSLETKYLEAFTNRYRVLLVLILMYLCPSIYHYFCNGTNH